MEHDVSEASPMSPLMHELSAYIAGTLKRRLPGEVVERARIHLVDTFAAMLSGSRLLPGKRMIAYVKPLGGAREAGVIGTRHVTTVLNAALANGTCGHSDETDDTHPPTRSHPGTSVVPSALAIAEKHQRPGRELISAMVLGYDVCARTLLALDPRKLVPTGRHAGATGQVFGAMAASAALLRLDAREVRYALSYTFEQTAGVTTMFRDTEHMEKAYAMGGMPAHNGAQAALLAASGFTGVEDIFSGEPDFFSIFSPQGDREALVRGLGRDYEILRGGIKRWTVGGPIQGPMHVLYELIREHGIRANDVERMLVGMPEEQREVVAGREMVDISLEHLLAVMLVDGTMTFAAAHDYGRAKDPAVAKLRRRIQAVADPSIPNAVRGWRGRITVTLKDGRTLMHQTLAAKGHSENPLNREEVSQKALDLMAPALGKQRGRKLIAALLDIDRLANVRALRRLYAA
jgi:2-methylcitrate dehydratase PrpD